MQDKFQKQALKHVAKLEKIIIKALDDYDKLEGAKLQDKLFDRIGDMNELVEKIRDAIDQVETTRYIPED